MVSKKREAMTKEEGEEAISKQATETEFHIMIITLDRLFEFCDLCR